VKIGRLTIERKTDKELAREHRDAAAIMRRGGLTRAAERAEKKARELERRGR
jgi:hypothetical protein